MVGGRTALKQIAQGGATDGQVLTWDTTNGWQPEPAAGGWTTYTRTAVSSTPYTVTAEQRIFGVTSTAAITINLRAAATAGAGAWIVVKDESGNRTNAITIDGSGAETIDGATTYVLANAYEAVTLYCDGSNWFAI